MLSTTCDEMDGVSSGLMMRVAVCGWGAVRGEVHESADRGSARREHSGVRARRAASGQKGAEARRCAHEAEGAQGGAERRAARGQEVPGRA